MVRAAGFPSTDVLPLASPEATRAADELVAVEAESHAARDRARRALWELHEANDELARAARGAAEHLERGKLPRPDSALEARVLDLGRLRELERATAAKQATLAQVYAQSFAVAGKTLRARAADPRFREALLWQNPGAVHTGLDWLLAHPEATNSTARKKLTLIARYLQRYCVKNDTIGFFGPIGWGELTTENVLRVSPGEQLLRSRHVYLEDWAIDAIAAVISAESDVRPFIAPRLLPTVTLIGTTLVYGYGDLKQQQVQPLTARVLTLCTGDTPARDIAGMLIAEYPDDIESSDEVYELLERMAAKKLIAWTLEPSSFFPPERDLRRLLEAIPDAAIRDRSMARLLPLEAARDRVAAAAGDVAKLDAALTAFAATFNDLSGQTAQRRGGQTYAARTPLYEDCVRDLDVVIGRVVLDRLGPAMAIVGQSARWFTAQLGTRYRAALEERYRALAGPAMGPVPYSQLVCGLDVVFPENGMCRIRAEVEAELARRWESLVGGDLARSRVEVDVATATEAAMRLFPAAAPGWPNARYVAPDFMIAARDADSIQRGEFELILGEVHLANSLMARLLSVHGPDGCDGSDVLMRAHAQDINGPRVVFTPSRERLHRVLNLSWDPEEIEVASSGRPTRPATQVIRVADLVVEPKGSSIAVRDRRTGRAFDIMQFIDRECSMMISNDFKPAPRATHIPRIKVAGVVTAREQWRFAATDLEWCRDNDPPPRLFATARAWASRHGMPRFVFVKIPEERKPLYVDFESPIYVDIFGKLVRTASQLVVTEMMPTVDETWIPDAHGNTYVGEFRVVFVDPTQYENPA